MKKNEGISLALQIIEVIGGVFAMALVTTFNVISRK